MIKRGDIIWIAAVDYIIESVTNETTLECTVNIAGPSTGVSYYLEPDLTVSCSIIKQVDWLVLLKELCKSFSFSLSYNFQGNWYAFQAVASYNDFPDSGSGTPNDEDIFTSTDSHTATGADGVSTGSSNFISASATFSTWDIVAGDVIIVEGIGYTIASVTNETTIVTDVIVITGTSLNYEIDIKTYSQHPMALKSF